ncbi:hypothetical protein CIB48_g5687 [Xylaria polymorpha]|nr:hypothetical protein CIB48_g5687 [Xylaria polymorpha]
MSAKNKAWRFNGYSADAIEYGFEKDEPYNDNDEDNKYNNEDTKIEFTYNLSPNGKPKNIPYATYAGMTGMGGGSHKRPRLLPDERNGGCNLRQHQLKPYPWYKYPLGPPETSQNTNKPNITGTARVAGFYPIPDGRSGGYDGRQDETIIYGNQSNNTHYFMNNNNRQYYVADAYPGKNEEGGSDMGWVHPTCGGSFNNASYYHTSMIFPSQCYEPNYMTPTVPFNNRGSGLCPFSGNRNAGGGNVDVTFFGGMNNSKARSGPGHEVVCRSL